MKKLRYKIFLLLGFLIVIMFFSNDFGIIDIEKTAIITAVAVDYDKDNDLYEVTTQVAVPEATDTNTENKKAQLSASGKTIGAALKNIGDTSGWFPQLAFCNLIILGDSTTQINCIKILDYFAKTLRVQDSALVVLSEKSAKELLQISTPLDNISSFALQKMLLKDLGFNNDVMRNDIKTFCTGYYSPSHSSYMPLIKIVEEKNQSQGQSDSSGDSSSQKGQEQEGNYLFDAKTTALYKNGFKVGELSGELTTCYNSLFDKFKNTTITVDDIKAGYEEQPHNYLLTVLRATPKIKLEVNTTSIDLNINLNLYCKISDQDADFSDETFVKNDKLPKSVSDALKDKMENLINELVETEKQTECDIFEIDKILYRYHHGEYAKYKDNYLDLINAKINVEVEGQK